VVFALNMETLSSFEMLIIIGVSTQETTIQIFNTVKNLNFRTIIINSCKSSIHLGRFSGTDQEERGEIEYLNTFGGRKDRVYEVYDRPRGPET
jgi:hypothetical protein